MGTSVTVRVSVIQDNVGLPYKVYLNAQGGEVEIEFITVIQWLPYSIDPFPTPRRMGYIFRGWYLDLEDESSVVTHETIVAASETHQIFAMWEKMIAELPKHLQQNILVITPNGDGLNDVIEIPMISYSKSLSFQVYNRRGQMVFNISQETDFVFDGSNLKDGVYIYILINNMDDGTLRTEHGTLSVHR